MISVNLPESAIKTPLFNPSEELLINGLRTRCESRFRQLHKMYSSALLGIITKIVKNDAVAEDILQESFLKIWNGIDGYDPIRGRLFTWMAATARHTAIDQLRSRAAINTSRNLNMDDFIEELELQRRTEMNPDTIGVKQFIGRLQLREKEILHLVYFQGYSHSEAAEVLNIPMGTLKTILRRAVSSLRLHFA